MGKAPSGILLKLWWGFSDDQNIYARIVPVVGGVCGSGGFNNHGQPAMKLVNNQSEAEIAQNSVETNLRHALRKMVANLMRVMRGTGKPDHLGNDIVRCAGAFDEYHSAFGGHPSRDFYSDALDLQKVREDYRPWVKEIDPKTAASSAADGTTDMMKAEQEIIRGVMQIIASQMLDQMTQVNQGSQEMHRGIRALQEARRKMKHKVRLD